MGSKTITSFISEGKKGKNRKMSYTLIRHKKSLIKNIKQLFGGEEVI